MANRKRVNLYNKQAAAVQYTGLKGKYIGCCPDCRLTLADWERCTPSGTPSVSGRYAKCSRCGYLSLVSKLKAYSTVNDDTVASAAKELL